MMDEHQLQSLAKVRVAEIIAEDVYYQKQIAELRTWCPWLPSSYLKAKLLWSEYSDSMCASWLIYDDETVKGFVEWIGGGIDLVVDNLDIN